LNPFWCICVEEKNNTQTMCCRGPKDGVKIPCGVKFMGLLVQIINLIFMIGGLGVVGLGIYVMVKLHELNSLLTISLPVGIIVLGGVVFFISFVGCLAARRKNKCWLTVYFIVLFLIAVSQIGVVIALYIYKDNIPDKLEDAWKDIKSGDQETIQNSFHCCGWNEKTPSKPDTTCKQKYNGTFCEHKVEDLVEDNLLWISIGGIALLVMEALGLVFSCWMCCGIREAEDDMEGAALLSDARRDRQHKYGDRSTPRENKYRDHNYFPDPINTSQASNSFDHHHHSGARDSHDSNLEWTI